jgi:hypothetical protein
MLILIFRGESMPTVPGTLVKVSNGSQLAGVEDTDAVSDEAKTGLGTHVSGWNRRATRQHGITLETFHPHS